MKYTKSNPPLICMMTQSTCYQETRTMNVLGVLWHSTGCNNTSLKRYIQPDDNASDKDKWIKLLGDNEYNNDWNHTNQNAGVNCWIGKLADGSITTVQTMPWNYRPWGCGAGKKGSCNSGWIQFEICESDLNDKQYFDAVYKEACELTAYLCKLYSINPTGNTICCGVTCPTILCHRESYDLGLGSGHSDVLHWFSKYGKTMDDVRKDVYNLLNSTSQQVTVKEVKEPAQAKQDKTNEEFIWDFLLNEIKNPYGVAGLMGNLFAESGLRSNNLQNSYEAKLNYTDKTYTEAVDKGKYKKFDSDNAGYGLAQWTYSSRKKALLEYIKSKNVSIGDTQAQLEYLMKELNSNYKTVMTALKNANTVKSASDSVLTKFENPKVQNTTVKKQRAEYGETYFEKFGGRKTSNTIEKVYKVYTMSSRNKDIAEEQLKRIQKSGYSGFIVKSGNAYKIQLGAYTEKTNAIAFKREMHKAGYATIIKEETKE